MGTPDPAERLARVRDAMRAEGQKLADVMARTDNQGHPTPTTANEDDQ